MAASAKNVKSEDLLGEKWDKCLVDGGIKMSSGLAIGKEIEKNARIARKTKKMNYFFRCRFLFDFI